MEVTICDSEDESDDNSSVVYVPSNKLNDNKNDDNNNSILTIININNDDNVYQTKYYSNAFIKIAVEYTEDEILNFQKIVNKEFDTSKSLDVDVLLNLSKDKFYNNNDIIHPLDSKKLFKIYFLHQQNKTNSNMENYYYYQSLDILYQIFNNITSLELKSGEQQLSIFKNEEKEEKEKKEIKKINKKNAIVQSNDDSVQSNDSVQFNDSFLNLLKTLQIILFEIHENQELIKKYQNNYNIGIASTIAFMEKLIASKNDNKNSKKILYLILFFANYYNNEFHDDPNIKKLNIIVLEKNDDGNEKFITNNNNELSWYGISLFCTISVFELKNSMKSLKNFFSINEKYNNYILLYDKDLDSLSFYELNIKTISDQLDYCLNMFMDSLVTKYVNTNNLLKCTNDLYNNSMEKVKETFQGQVNKANIEVNKKLKKLLQQKTTKEQTTTTIQEVLQLLNDLSIE